MLQAFRLLFFLLPTPPHCSSFSQPNRLTHCCLGRKRRLQRGARDLFTAGADPKPSCRSEKDEINKCLLEEFLHSFCSPRENYMYKSVYIVGFSDLFLPFLFTPLPRIHVTIFKSYQKFGSHFLITQFKNKKNPVVCYTCFLKHVIHTHLNYGILTLFDRSVNFTTLLYYVSVCVSD